MKQLKCRLRRPPCQKLPAREPENIMTLLRFYNSLSREKEIFKPINAERVRMYVCGPTVYDYAHIGNARPVIVFDVLYRLLRHVYGMSHVLYARNVTDVDDKINQRAARDYPDLALNEAIAHLTKTTHAQFQADIAALSCLPPDFEPRATDHLDDMRAMIEKLIEKNHAYVAADHVLFSVTSMKSRPRYGALSQRTLDDMIAGARVDVATYKRDEMDFVLWKPSKDGEPGWASPAGIQVKGRPGWHIECSAMSMAKLLVPFGGGFTCDDPQANMFDIHCGGIDLIFPHHENEIAQSCCALGTTKMANVWMHNGFLQVEGQKMSKSLGNFITIREVLQTDFPPYHDGVDEEMRTQWAGLAARFSMLQTHYREPINWTQRRLFEASGELYRWYHFLRTSDISLQKEEEVPMAVVAALADDLASWQAITLLRRFYKEKNAHALQAGMNLLGLYQHHFLARQDHPLFDRRLPLEENVILTMIEQRLQAIQAKDWAKADDIRATLQAKGLVLKDSKDPQTGNRITSWDLIS